MIREDRLNHHLVADTLVLVEVNALSGDVFVGINSLSSDIDHDGDQDVLIDIEGTRVQPDRASECLDPP